MSTTVVETSPAWIFKLLTEEKDADYYKNQIYAANKMAHKCAALRSFEAKIGIPPPPSPPPSSSVPPPSSSLPPPSSSLAPPSSSLRPPSSPLPPAPSSPPPINDTSTKSIPHSLMLSSMFNASVTPNLPSSLLGTEASSPNHRLDYFCEVLTRIREPIVMYEEQKGIPRDLHYSFVSLMTSIAHQTYNALLTIVTMLVNLVPLAEGFLQMLRFIIDKSIEICITPNKKDKAFKLVVFAGELVIMFFTAVIIMAIIFVPVLNLLFYAFFKLWAIVLPH